MTLAHWYLLIGVLLLAMGLASSAIKRLPFTSAMFYLAVGVLVGPTVLGLFHFNPLKESHLLERLTELAVLISLFAAGVKMPVPVSLRRWRAPILLASLSMTLTVGLIASFAWYFFGFPIGLAVLLGAVIAPTDPVLATDIQMRHPGDRNRLRFSLTCEAGMNDGSAFPFVMLGLGLLGLHDIGAWGAHWFFVDLLWSVGAGVAIGIVAGALLARWEFSLEARRAELWHDFLGLGLIAFAYGLSELLNAWGFLAVFFAAVSLRHHEIRLSGRPAEPPEMKPEEENCEKSTISGGSLLFKERLERLSELILILLVGGMLFLDSWSWRAVGFAFFVFLVARPLSVMLGLSLARIDWRRKLAVSWFGVRGIGSLYYLMYAIEQGLPEAYAVELIHLTLAVVTLSIVLHGVSAKISFTAER